MAQETVPPSETTEDNSCTCKTCRFFYGVDVPKVDILTWEQLLRNVSATSAHIFRTWLHLHIVLKRHGDVIHKRWLKKSQQHKAVILSEAWPGIPQTSRPDFASMRNGCARHAKCVDKRKSRETHMWPFINLESLLKHKTLLFYIFSRGRKLPWHFFWLDLTTARFDLPPADELIDCYRMRVVGGNNPKAYGAPIRLSTRGHGKDDSGLAVDKLAVHPYKMNVVLEIQSRILDFLYKCCSLILRDHDLNNIVRLPTQRFSFDMEITDMPLTSYAALGPYLHPESYNSDGMALLMQARMEEAADHLWTLREDPGYFAQQLQDWMEHDPFNVPDKYRRPDPELGTCRFWASCAARMVSHAYWAHMAWSVAHRCWTNFFEAFNMMQDASPAFDMYQDKPMVINAFRELDAYLMEVLEMPMFELRASLGPSPPLRASYTRPRSPCRPLLEELSRRPRASKGSIRLDVLFRCLTDNDLQRLHGISSIVEEIQRTLDIGNDGELITSFVAGHFADVAMIVEASRQLDAIQPWATIFRKAFDDDSDRYEEPRYCYVHDELEDIKDIVCFHTFRASKFLSWAITPTSLPYPCDKKPTEKTVNVMRTSEARLDQFWRLFDRSLREEVGISFGKLNITLGGCMSGRKLQRTPLWEKHHSYRAKSGNDNPDGINPNRPLSSAVTFMELDPNARVARPSKLSLLGDTPIKSNKIKTKGSSPLIMHSPVDSTTSSTTNCEAVLLEPKHEVIFHLNRRALKVFHGLFHNPSGATIAADICWSDILYAMGCLNFATEKLYGSSWQFLPPQDLLDVRDEETKKNAPNLKPIQFHEPHPSSKLRYWEAKRLGRRLHRHYAWTGGMFGPR